MQASVLLLLLLRILPDNEQDCAVSVLVCWVIGTSANKVTQAVVGGFGPHFSGGQPIGVGQLSY